MGKMNWNPDRLALTEQPSSTSAIIDEKIVPASFVDVTLPVQNDNGGQSHDIQVKYDVVSNVVSDLTGMVNEITRTIGLVTIEREKTKQVQAVSKARIRAAEEQTKQVRIQEKEATKRIKQQYQAEIKKAEFELLQIRDTLRIEKEKILSDKSKFESVLVTISKILDQLIQENNRLMEQDLFDEIQKNHDKMITIAETIASLYRIEK